MVDWKPDPNKTCKKCIHQEEHWEGGEYNPENAWSYKECSIPDSDEISSDDYLDEENINYLGNLAWIIRSIIETKAYFDSKKHQDSFDCFLANICPLYKEPKEEQSND